MTQAIIKVISICCLVIFNMIMPSSVEDKWCFIVLMFVFGITTYIDGLIEGSKKQ